MASPKPSAQHPTHLVSSLKCVHAVEIIAAQARVYSKHPESDNKPAIDAMRECPAAEGKARSLLTAKGDSKSAHNVAKIKGFDPGGP